jgi:hypothetical protein
MCRARILGLLFAVLGVCEGAPVFADAPQIPERAVGLRTRTSVTGCRHEGTVESSRCPPEQSLWWDFEDTLSLQFVVWANCCTDTSRFEAVSWLLPGDTIVVWSNDPGYSPPPGVMCPCECRYVLTVEYEGLTVESYVVRSAIDSLLEAYAAQRYPIRYQGSVPGFGKTRVTRGSASHGE